MRGCRAGSGSSDRRDRGERVAEGGAGVRGVPSSALAPCGAHRDHTAHRERSGREWEQ